MPATGGTAFTAAHGMVYRVHRHATDLGSASFPSISARLAEGDVFMGDVAQLAYRGLAGEQHHPDFT